MTDDTFALVMVGLAVVGVVIGFVLSRSLRMREERRVRAELAAELGKRRDRADATN